MVRNQEYWNNRLTKIEDIQHKAVDKYDKTLQDNFTKTLKRIESDLAVFYKRYATNEGITLEEARKRFSKGELREFKLTVEEYIDIAKNNNGSKELMKLLESASARVHISRLEALFLQFSNHVLSLYDTHIVEFNKLLTDTFKEQYNRVAWAVQTGTGIAYPLAVIPEERLAYIIKAPWSSDGVEFSARIYRDREQLVKILQTELIQAITLGEGVDPVARRIQKQTGIKYNQAARLVQTEFTAVATKGTREAYDYLDVEQYEYLATLDSRTSDICQTFDGKVFELKQLEVGVTSPPLHVNCRSTIVPYFEDEAQYMERVARDREGNNIRIPGNTSYAEWKEKYGTE